MGGCRPRPGLVKTGLGGGRPDQGILGQRQQYARCDLGSTRWVHHPVGGYLDPYFQEIYLQAESVPIFAKLAQHVSADALDHYVAALEGEVRKYLTKQVNYGKAAKRMYNIFRLTGRYSEAVYLRELFDEPASLLYQI